MCGWGYIFKHLSTFCVGGQGTPSGGKSLHRPETLHRPLSPETFLQICSPRKVLAIGGKSLHHAGPLSGLQSPGANGGATRNPKNTEKRDLADLENRTENRPRDGRQKIEETKSVWQDRRSNFWLGGCRVLKIFVKK